MSLTGACFDSGCLRTYRGGMADHPNDKASARESLLFFGKLAAYLIALFAFGFVVFLLTRKLQLHR